MIAHPDDKAVRWGFSTLGCPELSLPEVCALSAEFNLPFLELRALSNRTDLPRLAAEQKWTPDHVRTLLGQHGCELVVAGSSFKLVGNDPGSRSEFLEYCAWADSWNFPWVRIFGGGTWAQPLSETDFDHVVETINWWRSQRRERNWRIELLLETHDAFSGAQPCRKLIDRLDSPLGIIWDSHHTWRLAKESPAESWSLLGPWVRHVHLKDSVDTPSARHPYTYVLPGDGQAPLAEIMTVLREHFFGGIVSLEWEKLWHPYLPPLPAALERLHSQSWFASPVPRVIQWVDGHVA